MLGIRQKINIKLVIAIVLSIGSYFFLYNNFVKERENDIVFEQYVKVKNIIQVDEQIEDSMLDYDELPADKIPEGTARKKEEVIGKYATTTMLKSDFVRNDKIKKYVESEYAEEEREVRIYTNIQAFGGVGPGDRADLIFTENFSDTGQLGILKYEGVLVKEVLNDEGTNIAKIAKDKYNSTNIKPYLVVITCSQDMALEIETLQRDQEINFKFIKWTERSKKQDTQDKKLKIQEIIGETVVQ